MAKKVNCEGCGTEYQIDRNELNDKLCNDCLSNGSDNKNKSEEVLKKNKVSGPSFISQIIAMAIIFPGLIFILINTGEKSITSNPLIFIPAFIIHRFLSKAIDKMNNKTEDQTTNSIELSNQELDELRTHYANLTTDRLQSLLNEVKDLRPGAEQILLEELERRGIGDKKRTTASPV